MSMELNQKEIVGLREKLGLSQTDFGEKLGGVSQVVVCRWERGRSKPRPFAMRALVELWNDTMPKRRRKRKKGRR